MKKSLRYLSFLNIALFLSLVTISCVNNTSKVSLNWNNLDQIVSYFKQLSFILDSLKLDDKDLKSKVDKIIDKTDFKKMKKTDLELTIELFNKVKNQLESKSTSSFDKKDKLDILNQIKTHLALLKLSELVNIVDELINKLEEEKLKIEDRDLGFEDLKDIDNSTLKILESRHVSNQHSYPDYVNKFQTVSAEEIYKELYDRTFSIKFLVKLKNGDVLSNGTGTGWLLDYHKYENQNKYKLFIATNLHVLADFSNSLTEEQNKKFNYYDPSGNKVVGIGIGKADNVTDFSKKSNKTNLLNEVTSFYLNSKDFENYAKGDPWTIDKYSDALSDSKLVFGAVDFMKKNAVKKHQNTLQRDALSYYEYKKKNHLNEDEEIAWDDFFKNKYIPIMVDFGVFEVDIDLSKADSTLKSWIESAINGLDRYLARIAKTDNLPNQDKNISNYLQTTDYVSALFKKDNSENNLYNAKDIYIAGYPKNSYRSVWMQNNPIERNSSTLSSGWRNPTNDKTFAFANEIEEKVGRGLNFNIHDNYWHRVFATFYGYQYNVNFSSLYYGASGSLAYNEFGQMIGIYNNVKSNVEFGDLLQSATIAPFLQSNNIKVNDNVIYAYNLIDGTDKTKYKYQKSSFRENLQKLYPNGFSDKSKSTKLFKNIFN
ncbi:MIP family Ig-specific serine endopeptidase [Mycoplasma feriruminatoris]|uniref:MIP family Ig-specific serine endopeptidase n=1 Tax=Mycoplasma feriruminatoris TaxID=1179777 RepID=UPI00241D7F3F|nr:DUF31 family protein [Mycoplasma feriruminatoris]WFQ90371.1 hypothetical protein MFERI11561_00625 [Mycoplasma feriruminatoris]